MEDNDIRHTIHSASLRESNQTLSQKNLYQEDIALNELSLLQTPSNIGNQLSTSSNQSLYVTPNQSEIHLEHIAQTPKNHKAIQTSNITLNKTPKHVRKDKATQATGVSINRSHSLYKNKHFMIKRTPNLPKKQPQASNPSLIRKSSQGTGYFEEDSFYNILNQTTNI